MPQQPGAAPAAASQAKQAGRRLVSLDVLRGLTVAVMILVNNAGDGEVSYAQLRHSVWNGCTLTDIVFPAFLYIMGVSLALSFSARLTRGATRGSILGQVLKRSLLIFAIGLLLNALPFFHLGELRYYGVLQRIALCYALAGAVVLAGGVAAAAVATGTALALYWWLLVHTRVPGFGLPGVTIPLLDPYANLAAWLDRLLVPAAHLYHRGVYDPEGLLSTLPALGTTLLGVLSAAWLRDARPPWQKAAGLLAFGLALAGAGLLWSHSLPLNKRLWTSSFVLYTGGVSTCLFALFYWIIDGAVGRAQAWRRGLAPALIFGTNALAAYVLSEVLGIALGAIELPHGRTLQSWLYSLLPGWLGPAPFVSVLYSLLFAGVCFVPMLALYRRRIFLKL